MRFVRRLIPRFSLRTLFVIVTFSAFWFAWQVKIVREREAVRSQLQAEGASIWDPSEVPRPRGEGGMPRFFLGNDKTAVVRAGDAGAGPNWVRRLMGDHELKRSS